MHAKYLYISSRVRFQSRKAIIVARAHTLCFAPIGRIIDLHRAIPIIFDGLDLDLSSTHDCGDGVSI